MTLGQSLIAIGWLEQHTGFKWYIDEESNLCSGESLINCFSGGSLINGEPPKYKITGVDMAVGPDMTKVSVQIKALMKGGSFNWSDLFMYSTP